MITISSKSSNNKPEEQKSRMRLQNKGTYSTQTMHGFSFKVNKGLQFFLGKNICRFLPPLMVNTFRLIQRILTIFSVKVQLSSFA